MFDRILSFDIRYQQRLMRQAEELELRRREVEALEKIAATAQPQQPPTRRPSC